MSVSEPQYMWMESTKMDVKGRAVLKGNSGGEQSNEPSDTISHGEFIE
jgi:hypothetical protein